MIIPEDNYITYSLAAIILAVSLYGIANKTIFQALIFHPASVIHKKEYYRILSSGLVHNNIIHLGINLFMFYVFCSGLEETLKAQERMSLFVIIGNSLIGGNLLSLFLYRKDVNYSSAGASGIVFGCLCSYLILKPLEKHLVLPIFGAIPNVFTAVGYLAVMLIYSRRFNEGKIDYSIHVGGGVGGLITTISLYPNVITSII